MLSLLTMLIPPTVGVLVFWIIMRTCDPAGADRATLRFAAIWLPLAILLGVARTRLTTLRCTFRLSRATIRDEIALAKRAFVKTRYFAGPDRDHSRGNSSPSQDGSDSGGVRIGVSSLPDSIARAIRSNSCPALTPADAARDVVRARSRCVDRR